MSDDRAMTVLKADSSYQARLLKRLRDNFINIRDDLEDEGDRVYFGSTNQADEFRVVVDMLDDFDWSRIIPSIELPDLYGELRELRERLATPIPMVLHCPRCGLQHIDEPDPSIGWENPPHKSHLCRGCGAIWRPAAVPTAGVARLGNEGASDSWAPGDPTLRELAQAEARHVLRRPE